MTGILDYPKPPGMSMHDAIVMAQTTAAANYRTGYRITCPNCKRLITECMGPTDCAAVCEWTESFI